MSIPSTQYNYSWISGLLEELQDIPQTKLRPTLFEILRYQKKEHAYSNLLAYFLDSEEDHGLGTLFLSSFIQCVFDNYSSNNASTLDADEWRRRIDEGSFVVLREENNIDLLIRTDEEKTEENEEVIYEWAILIENKINHHLKNNPLDLYWDAVKTSHNSHKLGIILAPSNLQTIASQKVADWPDIIYTAITYQELKTQILRYLPNHFLKADERGVRLCHDFLIAIDRMDKAPTLKMEAEENIHHFHNIQDKVVELEKHIGDMKAYIIEHVSFHMRQFGFTQYTNKVGDSRKYYPDKEDSSLVGLRFYVDFRSILYESRLRCAFELEKGHTQKINSLISQLQQHGDLSEEIPLGGQVNSDHAHIVWLDRKLTHENITDGLRHWFSQLAPIITKTLEILPTIREKV